MPSSSPLANNTTRPTTPASPSSNGRAPIPAASAAGGSAAGGGASDTTGGGGASTTGRTQPGCAPPCAIAAAEAVDAARLLHSARCDSEDAKALSATRGWIEILLCAAAAYPGLPVLNSRAPIASQLPVALRNIGYATPCYGPRPRTYRLLNKVPLQLVPGRWRLLPSTRDFGATAAGPALDCVMADPWSRRFQANSALATSRAI